MTDPVRRLSDAELEALAKITPADIERAKAAWEQSAPPAAKKLLDAVWRLPRKAENEKVRDQECGGDGNIRPAGAAPPGVRLALSRP